jgi:hypothetical protein
MEQADSFAHADTLFSSSDFNKHTDLTAIYNPSANVSRTVWWSD